MTSSDALLLTFAVAGAAAIALVAYLLLRRRARRLAAARREPGVAVARRPPHTRYPIAFAHGWMGFDVVGLPGLRGEYFRGVRSHLADLGQPVRVLRVSPMAGVERRARQLAEQLDQLGAEKVNIVAHSMGGLDARYAISRLGMHTRVASLTTIGTPHRGTPLADRSFIFGDMSFLRRLLSGLGTDFDGLYDLTTKRMQQFNEEVSDMPDVTYASYVAWVPSEAEINRMLGPSFAYLNRVAGPNDGIVPASSQRWGEVLQEVQADHWAQIGWSNGFDARDFYEGLARLLAERGF